MKNNQRAPFQSVQRNTLHRMVLQYHPHIGQLYVPNIRARIPNELGGYYVRTNSSGFRSDIEFKKKKNGRPRILFFGDSFTAGFGVSNEQRFSDLIGDALGVEVYNFGLTGSGTDQQLLILKQFASDVEADLVVLCVMVENIERNMRSHHRTIDRYNGKFVFTPKPFFTLENGELVHHNNPVPMIRPETLHEEEEAEASSESTSRRLVNYLRRLYYHPRLEAFRPERSHDLSQTDLALRLLQVTNYQPYPAYQDAASPGWQLMAAIINQFVEAVSPVPMLIVPIPDSYFYRARPLQPVYQQRFENLADPARSVHVADITTPILQMPLEERTRLPFKTDFHFSPFGNERIAKFITEEIIRCRLLPAKTTSSTLNGRGKSPNTDKYVLGISCFYHNSAAALIKNGEIVAAAEEERFSRIKHDRNFPHRAINYCLEEAGIQQDDLAAVVYYDNAYQTFERLIHTQLAIGEDGEEAWLRVVPSWLQYKLSIPALIQRKLHYNGKILHEAHHRSHAASAFYPSPFKRAVILTIDGVGEWATASISVGEGNEITMLKEMHFPHSLGLLYSAFTQFIGFKVNNGEYKMMGLAPYGEPLYVDLIKDKLVDVKDDGSIELNLEYFAFLAEPRMTNERFADLFGGPARHPDDPVTQREMDIARSIQVVTEEIVLRMAQHAYELTGEEFLCLAGGVALNCVANGRLLREGPYKDIWIQPAAGDAGCALGAALDVWHSYYGQPRVLNDNGRSTQKGSYWGPAYSKNEIRAFLDTYGYSYRKLPEADRAETVASFIEAGKVVGHFTGRLEYGPRALGSRSILGDARNQEMQTTINLKIKYRESFRPFAPTVLAECVDEFFELDRETPYMLLVAPVKEERRLAYERRPDMDLFEIVRQPRSDVPAITHVDYSARIQSVRREDHPEYYDVIDAFRRQTGYGVIVNTSFNVRGEPIVCSPYDAYRCFMRTEMDVLIMGDFLLLKEEQPELAVEKGHIEFYDPDATLDLDEGRSHNRLREIFKEQFLPISAQYRLQNSQRINHSWKSIASQWHDCPQWNYAKLFEIPQELAHGQEDSNKMASSMIQYWQDDVINRPLLPVLETLLKVGREEFALAEDEEIFEDVSEFIYVMY